MFVIESNDQAARVGCAVRTGRSMVRTAHPTKTFVSFVIFVVNPTFLILVAALPREVSVVNMAS
jgi:hypothetical protein